MSRFHLYWSKGSGALPAAVVLQAAKVPHAATEMPLDEKTLRAPDFLKINPTGQIPALVLPDGTVMTESAAIAWYLADHFPAAKLLPPADDPRRAMLLRWLVFGAAQLYEDDLRYYYPQRYTTDPKGIDGVKAAGEAAFQHHIAMVADALKPGPFLLGSEMTIVDVYLAMLATWEPGKKVLPKRVELRRLVGGVRSDPRVAPAWQRLGFE